MEMPAFFRLIDPYLIRLYRITGHSLADFLLGTLVLALLAIILGELATALAFLALRKHLEEATAKAAKYQDLSVQALMAGDKEAYKAANKLANDAFSKSFFMQVALSAGFLFPIFFILAWMQYRFADLEFPLPFVGVSLGYIGIFILLYIPLYLLFRKAKYRLPYFHRLSELQATSRRKQNCADLPERPPEPGAPGDKPKDES